MILMCAVCFRGGEPLMRDSLNAGIFVLLGVTLTVLACVAVFFVHLARRADAPGRLPSTALRPGKPAPAYDSDSARLGTWGPASTFAEAMVDRSAGPGSYVGAGFSRPGGAQR